MSQSAIFISRYDMKRLLKNGDPILRDVAIISVNDTTKEEEEMRMLLEGHRYMSLQFKDQDDVTGMTPDQADQVNLFILENRDYPFVVHCFAGISRSAAIAMHINNVLKIGQGRLENYKEYNRRVLTLLEKSYMHQYED